MLWPDPVPDLAGGGLGGLITIAAWKPGGLCSLFVHAHYSCSQDRGRAQKLRCEHSLTQGQNLLPVDVFLNPHLPGFTVLSSSLSLPGTGDEIKSLNRSLKY